MDRAKREQKKFITLTSMINFMMLTLISLLALSCQSEIAAKFPDSLKKPTETSDINAPFITVWKLVEPSGEEFREASRTIILPLVEYYLDPHTEEQIPFNYNFIVDWGDGKTSEITSWDDGDKTHLYENYGTYTVTITGILETWNFDSTIPAFGEDISIEALIEIKQLGDVGWKNLRGAFTSCVNLEKINILPTNTNDVIDMSLMFANISRNVPSLDLNLSGLQTHNVTDMSYMFVNANIGQLNLLGLNTSNVTNMSGMFQTNNTSNISIDGLASFNTSNVTNMSEMFYEYPQGTLDLSSFDTSNVTGMYQMFASSKLTSLILTNFNTSNVTTMAGMFQSMTDLTTLNVSSFNTATVVYMPNMFSYLPQLSELDLRNFRLDGALSIKEMFKSSSIPTLKLNNWNLSNGPTTTDLFTDFTGSIYCDQGPFGDMLSPAPMTCQ